MENYQKKKILVIGMIILILLVIIWYLFRTRRGGRFVYPKCSRKYNRRKK
ncbi:MAG: hypothetical protein ACLTEH_06460 [Clostridia bacterium]